MVSAAVRREVKSKETLRFSPMYFEGRITRLMQGPPAQEEPPVQSPELLARLCSCGSCSRRGTASPQPPDHHAGQAVELSADKLGQASGPEADTSQSYRQPAAQQCLD